MKHSLRDRISVILLAAFLCILAVWGVVRTPDATSKSERRKLAQFPKLTLSTVLDTSAMEDLESYSLDQFPLRESFRTLNSILRRYVFLQRDVNGVYLADGSVGKIEYPLSESSITTAAVKINIIYERYVQGSGCKAVLAVVPDKNYYLADKNGYPAMDYNRLYELIEEGLTSSIERVDLRELLDGSDYYVTDTHWRQERLASVAQRLAAAFDLDRTLADESYESHTLSPFYGVYYGQAALPLKPDTLTYLTNNELAACTVYNYETGKTTGVYQEELFNGTDGYDVYLSGACPLLTIENPQATSGRKLIVFRDSFASSLIPWLIPSYESITLVDLRYMTTDAVGGFVDFSDADVLFLYSTLILNSSQTLR